MRGLRIILDKSVVVKLNNFEVDSLDRHFFQIVPSILKEEILADLTKDPIKKKAIGRIISTATELVAIAVSPWTIGKLSNTHFWAKK
jgi:hypothetical protein